MKRRGRTTSVVCLGLLAPLPLSVTGCVMGCPDVYYSDTVNVEVPRALFVPGGLVMLELCDGSECVTDEVRVPDEWRVWPARFSLFADELEEAFDEGDVSARAAITDAGGDEIASRELTLLLSVDEPHGPFCQEVLTGDVVFKKSDLMEQ